MGVFSKPYKFTFRLIASYLTQLYMNPIQTKSITSSILNALANYLSQRITYGKLMNYDDFVAFAMFGLLFGGSIPHYFYKILSSFLTENSRHPLLQLLIIERFVFMPAFSFFSLYVLSRLEGKNHEKSFDSAACVFPSVVEANFKYLTLLHYINLHFIPPALRVLVSSIIHFFSAIILSREKQKRERN